MKIISRFIDMLLGLYGITTCPICNRIVFATKDGAPAKHMDWSGKVCK